MTLYKIISEELKKANIDIEPEQLIELDIIEYMVLESAGILHLLKGQPLKCVFRLGYTSNMLFTDGKARSSLEFGLRDVVFNMGTPAIEKQREIHFLRIFSKILNFCQSAQDFEHQYHNMYGTLFAVIIPDENIEEAIRSSALFMAAGDLSKLKLSDLLLLEKRLTFYEMADTHLWILAKRLIARISQHKQTLGKEITEGQSCDYNQHRAAEKMVTLRYAQCELYRLFSVLDVKLIELINKQACPNYSSIA